jgi:4-alpha-glucanotransferase
VSLHDLARAAGLDPEYTSWRGEPARSSDDALLAMLRMLGPQMGFQCERPDDAAAAIAALERARWRDVVPPVVVGWDGVVDVPFSVPADADLGWEVEITTETGVVHRASGRLFELHADGHAWPGGVVHCIRHARVAVREDGYHDVKWNAAGVQGVARAIVAPVQAFGGPGVGRRRWGVFAPVYGLASPRSGPAGDLAALRELFAHASCSRRSSAAAAASWRRCRSWRSSSPSRARSRRTRRRAACSGTSCTSISTSSRRRRRLHLAIRPGCARGRCRSSPTR